MRCLQVKIGWLACVAILPLLGCGRSNDARFHANLLQMVANNVSEKHQQQIADILEAMYGTPDDPFVLPETGIGFAKTAHCRRAR